MGREKTAKNQALTSAPVFWQNRACITAEQGLQRRRGGCQLSGTGKVVAKNRRCFLVEGHLEWIGRPSLSQTDLCRGANSEWLASTCVTCARTDTIAVNLF